MDSVLKDSRFAKIATDKKFRPLEKKKRKVNIDNRFKSVLKDERFISRCSVDPRGRPKTYSSKETYEKFYELKDSSSDTDVSESDSESEENKKTVNKKQKVTNNALHDETDNLDNSEEDEVDDNDDSQKKSYEEFEKSNPEAGNDMDERIKEKLKDMSVDYARGIANLYSDSSSDDSSTDEENDDMTWEAVNKIGNLDADVEKTEEVTNRLALCNMDWDKINAEDIFLALSSFCSGGGCVKSIHVYISEFGKSRIEEEERIGPIELNRLAEEKKKTEETFDDILKSTKKAKLEEIKAMEKVREYQLNKLKYYYAVAEFDSADTANSVYTEVDGREFESSAIVFDLRFVPDDMTFDDQPVSSCTSLPDETTFKPKYFFYTALGANKVELTWDEEDKTRQEKIREVNKRELADDEDLSYLNELIASSSESEDNHEEESLQEVAKKKKKLKIKKNKEKDDNKNSDSDTNDIKSDDSGDDSDDQINKYRTLLLGMDNKIVRKDDEEGDMEFTWNDEQEPAQQQESGDLTQWEKYLKKKNEKREMKMKEKSKGSDNSEDYSSDDNNMLDKQDSKKNKRKIEDSDEEVENNDLALLVMDERDNNQHFNFKSIVEEEAQSKSKKKRLRKKKKSLPAEDKTQEDFDINVNDERFAAIYNRPEFNIDPSEQNFKKTKGMESLIGEKQKRVASGQISKMKKEEKKEKKSKLDPEITASLKLVKNKWAKNSKKKSKF